MSDRFSQASAASTSGLNEPGCESPGSANPMSTDERCSLCGGPKSRATTTCEALWPTPVAQDDGKTFEAHMAMKERMKGGPRHQPTSLTVVVKALEAGKWCPCRCHTSMSSAAASPARTSASPAREPGSKDHARAFGGSLLGSLGNFDPDTSSLKTSQLSLFGDSTGCLQTLPRAGSMRNGTIYQRQPLAPLTGGTGSGLWPTPAGMDAATGSVGRTATSGRHSLALGMLVNSGAINEATADEAVDRHSKLLAAHGTAKSKWPTPKGSASNYGRPRENDRGDLQAAVLPTPTANRRSGLQSHGVNVVTGQLNPMWVEWLQGFPLGWTEAE
jgi:hypothetical protein